MEEDFDRWSAIILDAKCKQHKDSADNAIKFLGEALKDISKLSERKVESFHGMFLQAVMSHLFQTLLMMTERHGMPTGQRLRIRTIIRRILIPVYCINGYGQMPESLTD